MTKNIYEPISGLRNEKDAAKFLNISKQTLIRLRKSGQINYYRIARRVLYGQEHLETFLLSANQRETNQINSTNITGGQQ